MSLYIFPRRRRRAAARRRAAMWGGRRSRFLVFEFLFIS